MLQRYLEKNPLCEKDIKNATLCEMELTTDQFSEAVDFLLENSTFHYLCGCCS